MKNLTEIAPEAIQTLACYLACPTESLLAYFEGGSMAMPRLPLSALESVHNIEATGVMQFCLESLPALDNFGAVVRSLLKMKRIEAK
jgi:hypothetical protein